MSLEQFKNRNVGTQNYKTLDIGTKPKTRMEKFLQVVKRIFRGEMHTVKYPFDMICLDF